MTRSVVPAVASAFIALTAFVITESGDPTADFYKSSRERPILFHECYRTGVTLEAESTVNFTVLWDSTGSLNGDFGNATIWTATRGSPDSTVKGSFVFRFDNATSSFRSTEPGLNEQSLSLVQPFNGFAYYFRLSIERQENPVVYKLYDLDPTCGNAAALLSVIDQDRQQGFEFVREIPEPRQVCCKESLCAPKPKKPFRGILLHSCYPPGFH
ncbi:uncharacterized protein LOC144121982 [Amblyomma americanum]